MTNQLYAIKDSDDLLNEFRRIIKEELSENKNEKPSEKKSPFIKIEEVCKLLQVSKPTVYHWVSKKFIIKYKFNSRTYFNKEEILDFLKSQK